VTAGATKADTRLLLLVPIFSEELDGVRSMSRITTVRVSEDSDAAAGDELEIVQPGL
jgi:hypothetical protein